jgi:hypothetical protein
MNLKRFDVISLTAFLFFEFIFLATIWPVRGAYCMGVLAAGTLMIIVLLSVLVGIIGPRVLKKHPELNEEVSAKSGETVMAGALWLLTALFLLINLLIVSGGFIRTSYGFLFAAVFFSGVWTAWTTSRRDHVTTARAFAIWMTITSLALGFLMFVVPRNT